MGYLKKIEALRKEISNNSLDGYLVSNHDEFQLMHSIPENNQLLWLTGFSGSYGNLLVTKSDLYFFTDPRYLIQSDIELNKIAKLRYKIIDVFDKNSIQQYQSEVRQLRLIGYNAKLYSGRAIKLLQNALNAEQKTFKIVKNDPIKKFIEAEIKLNGEESKIIYSDAFFIKMLDKKNTYTEKLATIISIIQKKINKKKNKNESYVLFTCPISICWLLNLRGADVENIPIVLMYAILALQQKQMTIFVKFPHTISQYVRDKLGSSLEIKPFEEIYKTFEQILCAGRNIYLDYDQSPLWFIADRQIDQILHLKDPTIQPRAHKNIDEINYIRRAHREDGIAWCKFLAWMELSIQKDNSLDELSVAQKLLEFKSVSKNFLSASFKTISAFEEHGAIIHYNPTQQSNAKISSKINALYLCDAGSQYRYGTTDITRTIAVSKKNSAEIKRRYTAVLCGHIDLASTIFPDGTTGAQIDAIARRHLWAQGADYAHSTGHGVGFCLAVHEGPHNISKFGTEPLRAGMIVSIEPGCYKPDKYGIRIENLYVIKNSIYNKNFLVFEPLTLVPIDISILLLDKMTTLQIQWLKNYNKLIKKYIFNDLDVETIEILNKRYKLT